MTNILFVCSANVDRSPTAEHVYKNQEGFEVKSAGTADYARKQVSAELVQWADIILCMSRRHKQYIEEKFPDIIINKVIDYLDIPDIFNYMEPKLVALIKEKVDEWLWRHQSKQS